MTPDEKVVIQKAVWDSGYPSACKLVLVKIANLLRLETGFCDAGENYLAKQCGGVTPRMLRNHIRTLEADGVLLVAEQAGSKKQNVYRIQLAELLCRKDIADIKKLRESRQPVARAPRAVQRGSKGKFSRKDITEGVGNKLPTGGGKILPSGRKDISDKVVEVDVSLKKQVEQVKPANELTAPQVLPQAEAKPKAEAEPEPEPEPEPTPTRLSAEDDFDFDTSAQSRSASDPLPVPPAPLPKPPLEPTPEQVMRPTLFQRSLDPRNFLRKQWSDHDYRELQCEHKTLGSTCSECKNEFVPAEIQRAVERDVQEQRELVNSYRW